MGLVGDVIVAVREKGPDPPSYLGVPAFTAVPATLGLLPLGVYYLVFTAVNPWGESAPTSEFTVTLAGSNQTINITMTTPQPGATGFRVYWSRSPAGQNGFFQVVGTSFSLVNTPIPGGAPGQPSLVGGYPPVGATGMIPDSDGQFVNAFTLYRWLNDALRKAGRIGGGIPDTTGIQATAGSAMYRISGKWIRFTSGWFDAWPVMFGRKSDVFLRNTFQGISGLFTTEQWTGDTTVFQMWPQPNRTGASARLGGDMTATDTDLFGIASIVPPGSLIDFLPLGMIQIDNEIMQYSGKPSITHLGGLVRGMGGTQPAAHVTFSAITELNIRLSGFRQPNEYVPGDSLKTLDVPLGWEEPILDYVLAQYRKAEQDTAQAQQLEKSFTESINVFAKASRTYTHPRQMGDSSQLVVYPGTFLGGVLVP
jgi:hypothetical protein